jgi:hypothetical protein
MLSAGYKRIYGVGNELFLFENSLFEAAKLLYSSFNSKNVYRNPYPTADDQRDLKDMSVSKKAQADRLPAWAFFGYQLRYS